MGPCSASLGTSHVEVDQIPAPKMALMENHAPYVFDSCIDVVEACTLYPIPGTFPTRPLDQPPCVDCARARWILQDDRGFPT